MKNLEQNTVKQGWLILALTNSAPINRKIHEKKIKHDKNHHLILYQNI